MIALVIIPAVIAVLAPRASRMAAVRLAPKWAALLLTALALTVALVTGMLLCLAAVVADAESPLIRIPKRWSSDTLRDSIPMPTAAGVIGGVIAAGLLMSAAVHAGRVVVRLRRTLSMAAALPVTADRLALVDDTSVFAYAVPGRHQRIVTSTGMLRALSARERRVLLAHEAAHLRHHHQIYAQLSRLAAAANPLMRPVARAVDLALERWADECAVQAVGDRVDVAHALGAAALAHRPVPAGTLAATQSHVVDRIRLLLAPPPRGRLFIAVLCAAVAACWLAGAVVVARVHTVMELAEVMTHH